jgi:hypothetical protein
MEFGVNQDGEVRIQNFGAELYMKDYLSQSNFNYGKFS